MLTAYEPTGNIAYKTGVGQFHYDRGRRPHTVAAVDNADGSIPGEPLCTTFGDNGKI